jgi:hypothetical protein
MVKLVYVVTMLLIMLALMEFYIWGYPVPFVYVLFKVPETIYQFGWASAYLSLQTASHCHFPRLVKPDCNEPLDLGLLVRHPNAGPVTDAGIQDRLENSNCRSLHNYELIYRNKCGGPTSKLHYNHWVSRIRVGAPPVPNG